MLSELLGVFIMERIQYGNSTIKYQIIRSNRIRENIPIGTFKIIPLIETATAVLNAQEILQASDRGVAIVFGCEDFITDIQGIHDDDEQSIFTPRTTIARLPVPIE